MKLIDYWPRFMQKLREFQDIAQAEQPEINELWTRINQAPDEFLLKTMTEYGIERWETILKPLGLAVSSTDTLEDRRFAIELMLSSRLPFTYRRLVQMLETILGAGNFEVTVYHDLYTLNVGVGFNAKSIYNRHIDILHYPFMQSDLKTRTHKEIKEVWFYPENQKIYNSLQKMLRKMIPANMLLVIYFMYNRHESISSKGYTHGTLKAFTHKEIREEHTL